MSQTVLSERCRNFRKLLLSRIENGLRAPGDAELEKIAHALGHPVSLFQQPDDELPLPLTFYRKRAKLTKTAQNRIHARMNFAVMQIDRLLRAVDLELELDLKPADPEDFGSAANVARSVRAFWQVPRGPIADLTHLLERAGVVVVVTDMGTRDLSGFSVWKHGMPPLLLVNADDLADRQRHTLAHELGHILMHHRGLVVETVDVERQADEFASEFLMPAEDIRPQLMGRIDLAKLAALKPVWRVSMASLLQRAGTLGLINARYKAYLWTLLGKSGYRTREPAELDFPAERPHLIRDLFEHYTKHLGYSADELGKMLHQEPHELREFYFNARDSSLRVLR